MPLPAWGLIIGIVVGFMASPNPVVAIICGGMIALVIWAIQGFPMESEAGKADLDQSQEQQF
jgi:hypothetical protein